MRASRFWTGALLAACLAGGRSASAGQVVTGQTADVRSLSLDEAMALATQTSELVTIAEADVERARAAEAQARSQHWPQIFGSAAYIRTLRSQFESLAEVAPGDGSFGSIAERLPFGRPNQWSVGLSLSQSVYTGGRIGAQVASAAAARQRTEIALTTTRAGLMLDIARAYFDAQLADRLVEIAQARIEDAEATFARATLMRRVGTLPEFDVLRARVARDTLRPALIQQRAARELAFMRLKQVLDLPLSAPLVLTTPLDDETPAPTPVLASATRAPVPNEAEIDTRAPVREAAQLVEAQEQAVRLAGSQRMPQFELSANFQQLAYPSTFLPVRDFMSNWTITASANMPLFTGGRIAAEVREARAGLSQSQAQLAQTRELAALDAADATLELQTARAAWEASAGTVEEAVSATRIAEVRFREGLSTQLEIFDAQLLLQQARVNRTIAARDLKLAQLRKALLPDLPLSTAGASQPMPQLPSAIQAPPQQTAPPQPENPPQPTAAVFAPQ